MGLEGSPEGPFTSLEACVSGLMVETGEAVAGSEHGMLIGCPISMLEKANKKFLYPRTPS